jgi:hypothetical protein
MPIYGDSFISERKEENEKKAAGFFGGIIGYYGFYLNSETFLFESREVLTFFLFHLLDNREF